MESCSRDPEIQRPTELLPLETFERFVDLAISCYFATHTTASNVTLAQLEVYCNKFNVHLDDEITRVTAA